MTELPPVIPPPPTPRIRTVAASGEPPRRARPSSRARRAHPLLNPFPLAVMTVATFLILFVLMAARLKAGADPAVRAGATSALTTASSGTRALVTRSSGAVEGAAPPAPAARSAGPAASRPVLTRASGSPVSTEGGDE